MYTSKLAANPTRMVIHWTARVMSILFLAAFAMMFLRQGVPFHDMSAREWISFFFFPLGAGLGMILSWRLEGLGGAITLVSVLISILVEDASAGGAYALTCASPGLFFLFSWVLSLSATDPAEEPSQRQPR